MKSKILFLIHLPPPIHGAALAGNNIRESRLINSRFDNHFINLTTSNSLGDIGKIRILKILEIFALWIKVFKTLFTGKFELCFITINSNGIAWYKEMVIVILTKIYRVPIVYFYHNKGVFINADTFIKHKIYQLQFNNSKTILLSKLLYNDISTFVKESDVFICPYGIEKKDFCSNKPLKEKNKKVLNILFLSNLIESKGVYVLLEACLALKNKQIPFQCTFIGGEGDISASQFKLKLQELGLQNEVAYQGRKFGVDKEKAFDEADIFVLPTFYHNECFPIANLEAMQYSVPIISTFEGAIPEMIIQGYNGFLVPQKSVDELALKLEELILNDEMRVEMGLAGRKMYETNFTLEIFENRLVEILQKCLKNNGNDVN